jgi:hypothetical protein
MGACDRKSTKMTETDWNRPVREGIGHSYARLVAATKSLANAGQRIFTTTSRLVNTRKAALVIC